MWYAAQHIYLLMTQIYRKSSSENEWAELQADLQRLVEWFEKWQVQFNADKSTILHLGSNNRL